MLLKVIACEIAFREICFAAARSPDVIDLEFLTQGHHDIPGAGRQEIQERIHAVPAGKFDAILLGYGLCSNMLVGLRSDHTRLVIPRAHDCITFFLGSKERYQKCFAERPGTYYYTSGWVECRQRRGLGADEAGGAFLPAHTGASAKATYEHWVKKFGAEKAQYLLEVMGRWTDNYSHGALIDFDFTKPLALDEQVRKICAERGWQFEKVEGDLRLLQCWLDAQWDSADFLVVQPGESVVASYDEGIIAATSDHVIETQPV